MKFRELKISERFIFESEISLPYSGFATGPWIKTGQRKYDHLDIDGLKNVRIGSINAEVIRQSTIKA